mgnify:CR=1 FL=1
MSRKLRMQTLIFSLIFSVASMGIMLYYSANKMIVIADVAQDSVDTTDTDMSDTTSVTDTVETDLPETDKSQLRMQQGSKSTNYLCIPLPEGFKAEQVTIENYYMNKQIKIFLQDAPENFYVTNVISGNLDRITDGKVEYTEDGVWLYFDLNDVYENRSILENDFLYVEFVHPREIYDKIVVIDVGHGGEDAGFTTETVCEKDIVLDIAQRLKAKLDETDIKVYYTRMDDSNPADEDRIYLANVVKADMFISIHTGYEEEDTKLYGTKAYYNASFFIPGFGSVELADLMEREVVTNIRGKGLGLFAADEECYILQSASVPATVLNVGYLSNKQEAILLEKEDYRQRIADGIYNGIMKAYED